MLHRPRAVRIARLHGLLAGMGCWLAAALAGAAPIILTPVFGPNDGPPLLQEEFMVPGADPGVELFVRNKHRVDISSYIPDEILLFVRDAGSLPEASFDVVLDGVSWMEYIARRGYDVYLVDVRAKARPVTSAAKEPLLSTATPAEAASAVRDVGAAIDYILKRRHATKLNLLGIAAGGGVMQKFATRNPERVNRLILYAPQAQPDDDPAELRVPVFFVHGGRDAFLTKARADAWYARLSNAPYRKFVELGDGTQSALIESSRTRLFETVQAYLDADLESAR